MDYTVLIKNAISRAIKERLIEDTLADRITYLKQYKAVMMIGLQPSLEKAKFIVDIENMIHDLQNQMPIQK